jgi:hypothetical protein|nr:MAG TPA: hypothetical protein [Caudoviricetes sp.]
MQDTLTLTQWLLENKMYALAIATFSFCIGVIVGYRFAYRINAGKIYTVKSECRVPRIGHYTREKTLITKHHRNGEVIDITCPYKGKNHFCYIDKEQCCFIQSKSFLKRITTHLHHTQQENK